MRAIWVGTIAFLSFVSASVAQFGPITFATSADYDNANPNVTGLFRDTVRPTEINSGLDLGGTGHTALNFTGTAPALGANDVTLYDTDPSTATPTLFSGSFSLSGDILFHEFNNSKAGGFLFFYNEGALGTNGLSIMLWNAGSTDRDLLQIADGNGPVDQLSSSLVTNNLGNTIGQDQWYRLTLDVTVTGGTFTLAAKVFNHTTATDPGSALGSQIGSTAFYTNTFAALNLQTSGEIGLAMRELNMDAPNTNMVSITNFSEVPEPASVTLVGFSLGLVGLAVVAARRRKSA